MAGLLSAACHIESIFFKVMNMEKTNHKTCAPLLPPFVRPLLNTKELRL